MKKAGAAAIHAASAYASSGWLAQTFYTDGSCGNVLDTTGFAVNTCFASNTTGYKFQLVEGER
jgi:hypothetical protein